MLNKTTVQNLTNPPQPTLTHPFQAELPALELGTSQLWATTVVLRREGADGGRGRQLQRL